MVYCRCRSTGHELSPTLQEKPRKYSKTRDRKMEKLRREKELEMAASHNRQTNSSSDENNLNLMIIFIMSTVYYNQR